MFWNAKNGRVSIGDTDMDYISFGKGEDILIMIPGLGDGLTTVKGMAVPMALTYRMYAGNYKVYMFSRKNHLDAGYSTRDMAADQARAMRILGISKAKVLGISQGGMIAQYLAIDYKGLMIDTAEKSYSMNYLKKYRRLYPLLGKIGKPKDFKRFLIQAASCMEHDAYAELERITCPTLIIGGGADEIVGQTSSHELADKIKNSELFVYEGLAHALYEEAGDFNDRVCAFLAK